MVDYDVKIKDIKSDYYKSLARYSMLEDAYNKKNYVINPNDDEETRQIKENLKEEILVDLGRTAELFFKYIIKIKRLELFPNEPYESSDSIKGFKDKATLSNPVIREIANKINASQDSLDNILAVGGIGPKAHDYNYIYRIIENFFPEINNSFIKFIELIAKSKIAEEEFDIEVDLNDQIETIQYIAFPEDIKLSQDEDENKKKIINRINSRIRTIDYSGDIFTRLRYFANDPNDKWYDIDKIFELVSEIKVFCNAINISSEKVNLNPKLLFANYIINEKREFSRFSKEEINRLLENKIIQKEPEILLDSLFYCSMSCDEILEILTCDEILKILFLRSKQFDKSYNYTDILINNLTKKEILYFFNLGIYDFEDMAWYLLSGKNSLERCLDKRYSIEEFEKMRVELCNSTNDFSNLELLNFLTIDSVKKLLKYPDLLEFYKTEFIKNINRVSYNFNDDGFQVLLANEEVRKNPESLYGLDKDQLMCYSIFANILRTDPSNESAINESNYYWDTINDHITENIKEFSYDKRLLCVLPLKLDPQDNKEILSILLDRGLDLKNLRGLDTTIFCMPPSLVRVIVKSLDILGEKLIVDNNINPAIYDVIQSLKKSYKSDIKIYKRRIPFRKVLVKNQTNSIVNDLIYDEESSLYLTNNSKNK